MGKHAIPRRPRTLRPWILVAHGGVLALAVAAIAATGPASGTDPSPDGTSTAYVLTSDVADSLQRTTSSGFGTADLGGSYSTSPSKKFSVTPGVGHVSSLAAGSSGSATLQPATHLDEQLQSTFALPALPSAGAGVTYGLDLRRQPNGDRYAITLRVAPKGALALTVARVRRGVATVLAGPTTLAAAATAGGSLVVEGYAAGSSPVQLQARAWLSGAAVPAWQLTSSDSTSAQIGSAGQVGLTASVASDTPASSVSVLGVRGWALTPPAASPTTSSSAASEIAGFPR